MTHATLGRYVFDIVQTIQVGALTSTTHGRWACGTCDIEDEADRLADLYNEKRNAANREISYAVERHAECCPGRAIQFSDRYSYQSGPCECR